MHYDEELGADFIYKCIDWHTSDTAFARPDPWNLIPMLHEILKRLEEGSTNQKLLEIKNRLDIHDITAKNADINVIAEIMANAFNEDAEFHNVIEVSPRNE